MLEEFIPGYESFMEDESSSTPEEVVEDAVELVSDSSEIEAKGAEGEADAAQLRGILDKFEELSRMSAYVKTFGVDKRFLFLYNHNAKLSSALNISFPSFESFDDQGTPNSSISIACLEAFEGMKKKFFDLLEWIKKKWLKFKTWVSEKITEWKLKVGKKATEVKNHVKSWIPAKVLNAPSAVKQYCSDAYVKTIEGYLDWIEGKYTEITNEVNRLKNTRDNSEFAISFDTWDARLKQEMAKNERENNSGIKGAVVISMLTATETIAARVQRLQNTSSALSDQCVKAIDDIKSKFKGKPEEITEEDQAKISKLAKIQNFTTESFSKVMSTVVGPFSRVTAWASSLKNTPNAPFNPTA